MGSSLKDYLAAIAPHIPHALVTAQDFVQIQSLAQILPVAALGLFEFRLSDTESAIDFHAAYTHPVALPDVSINNLAWNVCQLLCQQWANPTSFLHQQINSLILEFDWADYSSSLYIPSLFLALKPSSAPDISHQIETLLRQIDQPINSLCKTMLTHCIDALPANAHIAHVGIMLARPTEGLRLVLKHIPHHQLSDYLNQVGWNDPNDSFTSLVAKLSPFVDSFSLALEIGETVHPKIGLECFLDQQFHNESRWQLFLSYLVEANLCTSPKRDALLTWPGFSQKADYPELWPANLTPGDLFLASKAFSVFYRRINHIKITYQPGTLLSAKAYLAFGHRWINATDPHSHHTPIASTEVQLSWTANPSKF